MKRILLMLALVIARCGSGGGTLAFAQSCPVGHTLIQDTIYGPVAPSTGQPTLFFGTVTIAANSAGHGATGAAFGRIPFTLTISNGNLTACLIPNDTATPLNTTYSVKYSYTGDQGAAAPWTETWSVPTSGSPVTLATVRMLTTPPLLQGAASTIPGPTGPQGVIGPTGAASTIPGPTGPQGVIGPTGAASTIPGPTGPQGVIGPTGAASTIPGPTGPQGVIGPTGLSGTGNAPYSQTVSALTTLTVAASTHLQGVHPVGFCFDASTHQIACDPAPDSSGNLTFSWPGGFTGSITILGGGTGATGATGAQGAPGPTGPMGSLSGFGSPPTTAGIYCTQVTVTAGPSYAYGWGACGGSSTLSYTALSDAQYTAMTDLQYTGMTD